MCCDYLMAAGGLPRSLQVVGVGSELPVAALLTNCARLWVGSSSSFCGAACCCFTMVILMGSPLTPCCTLVYCRIEGLKVRTTGGSFSAGVSGFGCVLSFMIILLLLLEKTACTGRMAGLLAGPELAELCSLVL